MTEDYLHFIWGNKRFLTQDFELTNGKPISIAKFGCHNALLAGPDFNQGAVKMPDGIVIHGPIELHVKSSDWIRHGHHKDATYNNVILHVVFEHDKEIEQDGRILPTLELREYIDWSHYEKFKNFSLSKHDIVCAQQFLGLDPIFLQSMMQKALLRKWSEKIKSMKHHLNEGQSSMYYFLGAAFGTNHNKEAFLNTIAAIPVESLRTLTPDQRYQVLYSQSGLIAKDNQIAESWHFRGLRPSNFPMKRLRQFADYLCDDQLALLAELKSADEIIGTFHEIFQSMKSESNLTKQFQEHLIINAVIPYFHYLAQTKQDDKYQQLAFEILEKIAPENNRITRKWKGAGWKLANAYESQGLLALHRYYCSEKQCLSCEVGNALLQSENSQKDPKLIPVKFVV